MNGLAEIIAAWVGALGAFVTVIITVGGAIWVAFWQLGHDRAERAKDRALQAKREVLIESTKAALVAVQAVGDLAQLGRDVQEISDKMSDSLAKLNAGVAVASLEVLSRGKDLMQLVGESFMRTLVARARLAPDPDAKVQMGFLLHVISVQKELQAPFALFVAAVRRDLGIGGSGDEQVREALSLDLDELERTTSDALKALTG